MTDNRILITGASGFIGRNLIKGLTSADNKAYYHIGREPKGIWDNSGFYKCDLTNEKQVKDVLEKINPTHIIHLAAMASVRKDSPSDIIDLNIKGTLNLLQYCPDNTDFIFASSVLVYGSDDCCFYESDKCEPSTIYGVSKLACEHLIDIFYKKGKVRPRILRLCGNIGPHMSHGRIYDILNGQRQLRLFGKEPWNYLPYIEVGDTVDAINKAIDYNKPYAKCNITPDDNLSLRQVIEICGEKVGEPIAMFSEGHQQPEHLCCHNESAYYQLNWRPSFNSEAAVSAGIDDYLSTIQFKNTKEINNECATV